MNYIAYYRVSTKRQGVSGLGLSAQRTQVRDFISSNDNITEEYTEVESGRNCNRLQLKIALDRCKDLKATLLIAKLDRLSRNASFILTLRDSNVQFKCVDMPQADSFTTGVLAMVAQQEVENTSKRIKKALKEIKTNIKNNGFHKSKAGNIITKLGSDKEIPLEVRTKGTEAIKKKARENPESIKAGAMIIKLMEEDNATLNNTAIMMNHLGFKTPKGKSFGATQVKRLYERYKNN